MTLIQVVGIGLDGSAGLTDAVRQMVEQASLLMGSPRHLSYFPDYSGDRLILGDLTIALNTLRQHLSSLESEPAIVILTSGDPLFFGLGRLLLKEFPAEKLSFHPHLSSVQLAFSRVKVPWQDARIVSAHGRSTDELIQALQQGCEKIAVLTDSHHTPGAIARLLTSLELPSDYQLWVCENLGSAAERIQAFSLQVSVDFGSLQAQTFAPLNVVILLRQMKEITELDLQSLPLLGLPDQTFLSFDDRPGLMTKREVRILVLGELALQPGQTIWDVGAGTGSVAIEIARLFPTSHIYAIEKTAMGSALIEQNCQRFQVANVTSTHGTAPDILNALPTPDRIFVGGSGGNLKPILDTCAARLTVEGTLVLALATLQHLTTTLTWLDDPDRCNEWSYRLLQVQLSRSVPVASLTRFAPLNPVTLITAVKVLGKVARP